MQFYISNKVFVKNPSFEINKYESKGFPLDAKYMQVGASENIYICLIK